MLGLPEATGQVNDRMMLTLGSMMDNLKRWDLTKATRIITRIEDRLGVHGINFNIVFAHLMVCYFSKTNQAS